MEQKIFRKKFINFFGFFLFQFLALIIVILASSYILGGFTRGVIIGIIAFFTSFWLYFFLFRMLTAGREIKRIIVLDEGLRLDLKKKKSIEIKFSEIQKIDCYSATGAINLFWGNLSKYVGYYRLITAKGKFIIPLSLSKKKELLKIIILRSNLRKKAPSFKRSLFGDAFVWQGMRGALFYWEKEEGYVPNKKDLSIAMGRFSKSGLFAGLIILLFVIIFTALLWLIY